MSRPRNEAFDALGILDGINPPDKPSKAEAGRIVKALAIIRQITPDVTADEIHRAAFEYRTKWPEIDVSSTAIAAHWRKFHTAALQRNNQGTEMENVREMMNTATGEDYGRLQMRLRNIEDGR